MKKGFTISELILVLGIIGVISALTLPSLINDVSGAKIGPSLAKAVSNFEHATKALIYENEYETLLDDENLKPKLNDQITILEVENFLKNSINQFMLIEKTGLDLTFNTHYALLSDNISIAILPGKVSFTKDLPSYEQKITTVMIDINALESPNVDGTDRFYFDLMNDGSLKPWGANGEWKKLCPKGKVPTDLKYCAGHVFENGFKVLYE